MAQYYTDFGEYTTGQAPSDWTLSFLDGLAAAVEEDAAAEGGKWLALDEATNQVNQDQFARWDTPSADPDAGEVEIYMQWLETATAGNDDQPFLFARAPDLTVDRSCYRLGPRNTSTTEIARYTPGFSALASASAIAPASTLLRTRVRLSGGNIYSKVWAASTTEPLVWQASTTDSTFATGDLGIHFRRNRGGESTKIDVFSVGTNGDPAPTEPPVAGESADFTAAGSLAADAAVSAPGAANFVATGTLVADADIVLPAAPTGLFVDRLAANSARLNWDSDGQDVDLEIREVLDPGTGIAIQVSDSSYLQTGLPADVEFEFRVRTAAEPSEWSSWVQFTTEEAYAAPTGVQFTDLTVPDVTLTWDDMGSQFTYYIYLRIPANPSGGVIETHRLSGTSYTFEGVPSEEVGAEVEAGVEVERFDSSGPTTTVTGTLLAEDLGQAADLSGSGTLVATATKVTSVSTAAVFSAALAAAPAVDKSVGTTLEGTGTLTALIAATKSSSGGFTSTGTLSALASVADASEANFSATALLAARPHVTASSATTLVGAGVLSADSTATRSLSTELLGTGTLTGQPATAGSVFVAATFSGEGVLLADAASSGQKSGASDLAGTGTLHAAPSKITDLSATLAATGTAGADPNVAKDAVSELEGQATLQAAPSTVTNLQVTLTANGTLSATGVVETAQTASAILTAQSTLEAGTVRDAAGVAVYTGDLQVSASPAVVRSAGGDMTGTGVLAAEPARVRVGDCAFVATGALTAEAETAVIQNTGAEATGAGVLVAEPARTVSVVVPLAAQLQLEAQGAVDQQAGCDFTCEATLQADTLGGTAVYRGYLYAKGVAIKPAMTCYTKLKPSFTGESGLSPSVTGTVIIKPR